jgi:adenylate cyclase
MSGLADTYSQFAFLGLLPTSQAQARARELALAAVAGNDALAEAHLAVAGVKNLYDWDWPGAEVEYRRSIELDPNLAEARRAYATYLVLNCIS